MKRRGWGFATAVEGSAFVPALAFFFKRGLDLKKERS
jgi:hypothetical protein